MWKVVLEFLAWGNRQIRKATHPGGIATHILETMTVLSLLDF